MKRPLVYLAICAALMLALTGCGEKTAEETPAPAPAAEETATVTIADDRIIGSWKGEDGKVEFREDGVLVLDDGSQFPFSMPSSEELEIGFASGTRAYTVEWDGDDRHGVVAEGATDTAPVWYERTK